MKRVLLAVTLFVVFAATPSTARADDSLAYASLTNIRPSGDVQLKQETQIAVGFWTDHGVTACDAITVWIADFPMGTTVGAGHACAIYLDSYFIGAQRRRDLHGGDETQDEEECALVVHEVGHAEGLAHTASGVMSPTVGAIPPACRDFASLNTLRTQTPRPRVSDSRTSQRSHRSRSRT